MTASLADIRAALDRCRFPGRSASDICDVVRAPSEYASSHPLQELTIVFRDGTTLEVMFKDLSAQHDSLSPTVQPEFLRDPLREIHAYELWSSVPQSMTAQFYGASIREECGRYWLFVEKVRGDALWAIGDFEVWRNVAKWLARWHLTAAQLPRSVSQSSRWIRYDAGYFRTLCSRAQDFNASVSQRARVLRDLAADGEFRERLERFATLPVTFIHGEFYASNILVADRDPSGRICPIDWEMAGIGSGLLDLAALISGRWSDGQRHVMALAYFESLCAADDRSYRDESEFLDALDDCRLLLALQWLGWARNWTPPPQHAHDWFNDILELSHKAACR